jgi:septal ring factor EnvC (AmiA/AmiB activator)
MIGGAVVMLLRMWRNLSVSVRFALTAVLLTLDVGVAYAETDDVSDRLQRIRLEVSQTEKNIGGLKSEFTKLKRDERMLNSEIETLSASEVDLTRKSQDTAREKEKLTRDVEIAEERVAAQQALIRERLRALYVHSSVAGRPQYIGFSARGDLERVAVYARTVRSFDEGRFHDVKRAVDSLIASRTALEVTLRESLRVQGELQAKRNDLEAKRTALQGVIRQIKEKQQAAQQSLAKLRAEASKMEELLRAITSREDSVEVVPQPESSGTPVDSEAPRVVTPVTVESKSSGDLRVEDVMDPEGLFGKSVRVSYPVKGQLLRSFGKAKVTDFSDIIFSKGMEFKTAESSQVKAVLGGRVAFSGSMPGYDTVVIIDHGSRSYSLYGRLGKAFVAKGDLVKRGGSLGVTSAPDTKGRNFYFETRKNGNPVDPSGVLSRAS